jgi:hypothetical protein
MSGMKAGERLPTGRPPRFSLYAGYSQLPGLDSNQQPSG